MVGNLAKLEAEYERLHLQWESAQELLPPEEEMPDLLRKVTTAGNKAGIEFMLFQPKPPVVEGALQGAPRERAGSGAGTTSWGCSSAGSRTSRGSST